MVEPSSFCTMCTYTCFKELIGLLLSLSIHHPGANFYCMVDSKTKDVIDKMTPKINLNIIFNVCLDKYTGLNRQMMEQMNIWSEFQMKKADTITNALKTEDDTLFLDTDIIILDKINDIDNTKDIGLSPHYIRKCDTDNFGYYNGGCMWVKNKNIPELWKMYTKTSRFYDQASLEDLAKNYKESMFEFPKNFNFSWWRVFQSDLSPQIIANKVNVQNNSIYYENKPLKFVHTHFTHTDQASVQFNNLIINYLHRCKKYKELICLERMLKDKWIIKIPKQPRNDMWNHDNTSFRELAMLLQKNNKDVKIELTDEVHCSLSESIILYDRPTSQWFNQDLKQSSLILLGNGHINIEGKELEKYGLNVKPWIFWPRRPFIVEKILDSNKILNYDERKTGSIFIGNFENQVQKQYRQTNQDWESVLDEYHCTAGTKHKFTQEEYLNKLRNSRYGLCLRGFGSKCHREVELMAFGTVPIITSEVSIDSFMNPPEENKHYIRCNTPENLKQIISKISEQQWQIMSKNCYEWYQRNVYSKNCMNTVLTKILYN